MAKIRHIAFFTEDPKALAEFYVDVFGMKITKVMDEESEESGTAVFVTDGYIDVALIRSKDRNARLGINHYGFTIDPSEQASILAKIEKRGIKAKTPPPDRPYIEIAVWDNDGNKIDLSTTGLRDAAE